MKFLGRGNYLNVKENHTSSYYVCNNTLLLINCGLNIYQKLLDLHLLDEINKVKIILTSNESKNCATLAQLITYLKEEKDFTSKQIILYTGGCINVNLYLSTQGIIEKEDYLYWEVQKKINLLELNITVEFFETSHKLSIKNYGLILHDSKEKVVYLADSRTNNLFLNESLINNEIERLYISIEVQEKEKAHTFTYDELFSFFENTSYKEKIYIMDINKEFNYYLQYKARASGFHIVNVQKGL